MTVLKNLGMNVVLKHRDKESILKYVEALKNLKVEWVRLEFNFYDKEPKELMIFLIELLCKENIKILGLLTGLIPGNLITTFIPSMYFQAPTDMLPEYLEYTNDTVQSYAKYINHWEIWNEENTVRFWVRSPNPTEYMELLIPTVKVIKNIQPNSTIVMGAIMGDDVTQFAPYQYMNFLKVARSLGIDNYVDIYNFHPYIPQCYFSVAKEETYLPKIKVAIDNFINAHSISNKPIWITEFGICPRWVKINETAIATIYRELYSYLNQKGIPLFFWVLTDFPKNQFYSRWNPELFFGFLTTGLKEKVLFSSFTNLI